MSSSPTVAAGSVYVGSEDTNLYAIDAATGNEEWVFGTGSPIESSPIVADGTVFFGSNGGTLYAVETDGISSSIGTRAELGTLGHNDGWPFLDKPITVPWYKSYITPDITGIGIFLLITAGMVGGFSIVHKFKSQTTPDSDLDFETSGDSDQTTPPEVRLGQLESKMENESKHLTEREIAEVIELTEGDSDDE